jgi:hypothetical protein
MSIRMQRGGRARWKRGAQLLALAGLAGLSGNAAAGSFEFLGVDASYSLLGAYAIAIRTQAASDGVINAPPAASIPLPTYLKVPESANYDDGDRNFRKWGIVNNRVSGLGELHFNKDNYDVIIRGDAFYDNAYRRSNHNDSPGTVNKYGAHDEFTADTRRYDGLRIRLLEAYASGTWQLSDQSALNLRIGRQVAAWGESLFFDGIALTQGPADATKATVPGADVKSILLPVNQISMSLSLTDRLTLLGQYKLQFQETEINPVGEFYSVADVIGPGREFEWGIYNPLYLPAYSGVNLTGSTQPNGQNDVAAAVQLISGFIRQNGQLPALNQLTPTVVSTVNALTAQINALGLPAVTVPQTILALAVPPGTPKYVNPTYAGDIKPSHHGQYGLGIKYAFTPSTTAGLYYLRYHDTIGLPVQNYGAALLVPSNVPGVQDITTQTLGITVPVTYNIRNYDGVKMFAGSLSTEFLGANFGAEAIYRRGQPVLVDVDGGLTGPIPTPSRARIGQLDLNALYIFGSTPWWDAITLVADVGVNRVLGVDGVVSEANPDHPTSDQLHYSTSAWAYYFLWFIDRKNIFDGWDLQVPMSFAGVGAGHSSLLSGFGSLMGKNDRRASVGINFTRLQALQLGLTYSAYIGPADFKDRPYQDRDNLGLTVKYNF